MKIRPPYSVIFLFVGILAMLYSCNQGPKDSALTQAQVDSTSVQDSTQRVSKVKKIFYSVPAPMETAGMLKEAGATYNASLLNDIHNVSKYTTLHSRALNLGVYGADLSYTSIFNQNQESIIYLSCTKQLADEIGVSKAFSDDNVDRMQANIDDRDSLLKIVSETYYTLDSYLKDAGRDNVSAMVIAAGWVEALHIATQVAESPGVKSNDIKASIASQKASLEILISLVKDYNNQGDLNDILDDLNSLKETFDKVTVNKGANGQNESKGNVIGQKKTYQMDDQTFQDLKKKVEQIRSKYIQ